MAILDARTASGPDRTHYTYVAKIYEEGREEGKGVSRPRRLTSLSPSPLSPAVAKRARPISAEISTAKRSNATTRQQAKVLEEAASAEEEEGNELPTLAELLELGAM